MGSKVERIREPDSLPSSHNHVAETRRIRRAPRAHLLVPLVRHDCQYDRCDDVEPCDGHVVRDWLSLDCFRLYCALEPLLTNQNNSDGTPPDHLGEVVGLLVTVKYAIVDAVENCERIKASNPGKFVGQVTVTGITLAWIGSWFSGCTLILFLVYALLLTPGVINNRLPQKGYIVVEPYLRVYIAIAKEKLNKLLAMAKQRVSAPQPASALQPASTPPAIPDTPVAAAEKTQEQKKVD